MLGYLTFRDTGWNTFNAALTNAATTSEYGAELSRGESSTFAAATRPDNIAINTSLRQQLLCSALCLRLSLGG